MAKAPHIPEDHRPLSERIRPQKVDEVVGNRHAVDELMAWAQAWSTSTRPPRWRAAILSGPPGVGKTTLAWAVARAFGWTVVEMNASDARNQSAVDQVAGRASLTHTLGDTGTYRTPAQGGRTLILVDEADCMTGGRGSGGAGSKPPASTLRDFLIGRYGSVDSLNSAWGLGAPGRPTPFPDWSQVPTTGGRGAWTRLSEAQRDLTDWKGSSRPTDPSDRGGYGALVRLARDTRQPVVLTVNDEGELTRRAGGIASSAFRIRFGPVTDPEMRAFLRRIVLKEKLSVGAPALDAIVARSHGDLRAAVNDIEAIGPLPPGPLQSSVLAVRDSTTDLWDVTGRVLTEPRFYRSVEIRDRADATPEDLWPWIEENIPRFAPTALSLQRALDRLSQAEIHLTRARRQRVFALWSFASEIMTGGASLALASDGGEVYGTVGFPQFLSAMGRSRATRLTRDVLLLKIGRFTHASKRKTNDALLPFLRQLFEPAGRGRAGQLALQQSLVRGFELTPDEVSFLGGTPGAEEAPPKESVDEPPTRPAPPPTRTATARASPKPATAKSGPADRPKARKKVQRRLGEF